jgi:serine/threonine-protein kinase
MGTPLYMSPEQVKGKKLDQRSDIYSFGVTCYHMLTGRPPFHGESAVAVAVQHVNDEPELLRLQRPDLPQAMCDLVHRMMQKDPAARHHDAHALLNDVRRLLKAYKETGAAQEAALAELASASQSSNSSDNARRVAIAVTACVLLAAAGAGIGWMQRTPSLLELERSNRAGVMVAASAYDQYLQAQFSGGLEEEWEAVRKNWTSKADELWTIRATEQLALLYLKQPDRAEDAKRELGKLESYRSESPRYELEAKLGQAVLAVSAARPDYARAEQILSGSRTEFETQLTGSWRDRYERLRDEVAEKQHPPPQQPQ